MAAIDESVVNIQPSFTGFRTALKTGLATATKGITATVRLTASTTGFAADARAKLALIKNMPTVKVGLRADATGFARSVREELAKRGQPEVKVQLVADADSLKNLATQAAAASAGGATRRSKATRKKASGVQYSRLRKPVEKVEQARQKAIETKFARLRVVEERFLRDEDSAFREQAKRLKATQDEVFKSYASNFNDINESHANALAEDAKRTREAAKAQARETQRVRTEAEKVERDRQVAVANDKNNLTRTNAEQISQLRERALQEDARRTAAAAAREKQTINDVARAEARSLSERKKRRKSLSDDVKPKIINYGGAGIRPINLLYGSLIALSPVLVAVASTAIQASTSLVALGAAAYGTTLAVVGITNAFSGVLGAFKLHQAAVKSDTAASARQAAETAANQRQIAGARRSLIDATKAEKDAQTDLTKSYIEARQAVKDLREELSDLRRQEEGDAIDLARAKEDQQATNDNFFASTLDRREAAHKVADAEDALSDTQTKRSKTAKELADREKKGIAQSPEVVKARDEARKATDRRKDAEDSLKDAQDALTAATDKGSAADAQLKDKLKDLSPVGRKFYDWLVDSEDMFKRYRRSMERAILPGFLSFLQDINAKPKGGKGKSTLDILVDGVNGVGKAVSKTAKKTGKFLRTPFAKNTFKSLNKDQAKTFETLGKAGVIFLRPVFRLLKAASPLTKRFANYLVTIAQKFSDFIDRFSDKELADYFQDAGDQLGKFYNIIKNLGSFLFSVFGASLPTGDNLTSRIESATAQLAKWAKSPEGAENITKFFEFFKNIDYTRLSQTVGQIVALNGIFKAGRFIGKHPMFILLGYLAAGFPETTADVLEFATSSLTTLLGYFEKHPAAAVTVLSILSAFKLGKTLGIKLKIPAVTALKDALTKKFKFLDKFLGDGASTAVMNVNARVVNINGPVAGGTAGIVTKGATVASIVGAIAVDAPALIALTALAAVVAAGIYGYNTPEAKKQREQNKIDGATFNNPFAVKPPTPLKNPLDSGNLNPRVTGLDKGGRKRLQTAYLKSGRDKAITDEKNAATVLRRAVSTTGGKQLVRNDPSQSKPLQDYITARKKTIIADAKYVTQTKGTETAQANLTTEIYKSRTALSQTLQTYGFSKDEADKYAASVYNVDDLQKDAKLSADDVRESVKKWGKTARNTTTDVNGLKDGTVKLNTEIDKVTGKKIITVSMDGEKTVFEKLSEALTYQRALQTGLSLKSAGQAIKRDVEATKNQLYGHAATGGHIRGRGTATSDSIPTMLSNGEYVMPTKTVQHYGLGAMEAMRRRKIPAFAEGGSVGTPAWKFPVDVSKTQVPDAYSSSESAQAPGVASGSVKVGEIAEATARAMGATTKQLVSLIEAGLVESGLQNINYGDRDSLGFLQQRASWGSRAARLDVATATRKYISTAKRMDNPKLTAGELAANVQRPRVDLRYKYGAREADAIAVINRKTPFLDNYVGGGNPAVPGGYDTKNGLVAFGRWLQAKGYDVSEHPAFGGVTAGGHVKDSQHYRASAIDVNHGAGTSAREQAYLRLILPEARRRGFRSIFMESGHFNHAHFDLGRGHKDGGQVNAQRLAAGGQARALPSYGWDQLPARLYDNGGQIEPGLTLVNNKTGNNETILNNTQAKATGEPQTMRLDRRDVMQLAQAIAAASNQTVQMDGQKVAEITNRYSYLPAGV